MGACLARRVTSVEVFPRVHSRSQTKSLCRVAIGHPVVPPNISLQVTVQSVTQFAYANWPPLSPAADFAGS